MSDFELCIPKNGSKKTSKKMSAYVGADFELWMPEPGALLDLEFDEVEPGVFLAQFDSSSVKAKYA
jgi:hypothetical protein